MKQQAKIFLIYTGGTIGMIKDVKTGSLLSFNFDNLLESIPELNFLDCKISHTSFEEPIDSSNITIGCWVKIAKIIKNNYKNYDGFVILHGSDTMSYSASALSFMLENLSKPVIFTGSQLPIGDLRTDAKENLITSIQIASMQNNYQPILREVGLYFEYKLYRGNRTTKVNAEHFQAFSSPNYPQLAESGVHLKFNTPFLSLGNDQPLKLNLKFSNKVAILKIFPGISESIVRSILTSKALKGVVLETYGAGNAITASWFISLLDQAIKKGIHVINVSQCVGGSVLMGQYETSLKLKSIGVISGADMTTEASICKLMYLLGQKTPHQDFKKLFETSLRGER